MSNKDFYSGGTNRLPPGYEWRHRGGRWCRCRKISSVRAARIATQLTERAQRWVFTSHTQELAARALGFRPPPEGAS